MKLEKRTILITGGSSGIGRCLAEELVQAGNRIIIASRSAQSNRPEMIALTCDLTEQTSVTELVARLKKEDLNPDILINNAAIQCTPKFIEGNFDFHSIEKEITVNFTAVAWLTSLLLPLLMRHKPSAIVNISSGLALYPKSSSAIYCATKAALHSFSQSLRYQLEETVVSVHEVILPLVDTPMTEGRGSGKISAKAAAGAIIDGLKRDKEEIYVGKAKWLPLLSRISPAIAQNILKKH
ncbi:MAG: SDR family NAD(P)-dependent oxidoreductase [Deltaproteobacteria bacterium]|nr:SDR family NAD(P)-dependent oxidoreductase [Deltaproteobacteria bacterium]